MSSVTSRGVIGVLYEHPKWFEPLFAELDNRGLPYERIHANRLTYDPAVTSLPYSVVLNRMSPSSWLRGNEAGLFATPNFLSYLEAIGVPVMNGSHAFSYEISKARQIGLLARLGIRYPRARVVTSGADLSGAADGLEFPVLIKPNLGGSGARIRVFDDRSELSAAAELGPLDFGPDHTALVQEYLPAEGDAIVRLEFLDGNFLYAIRLLLVPGSFNLCPADYCDIPGIDGVTADSRLAVQDYLPPPDIIRDAGRILAATGATVGGVEYLVNVKDGHPYFYDVNVLSNFVTDAPDVVGFDPTVDLVDYVARVAGTPSRAVSIA